MKIFVSQRIIRRRFPGNVSEAQYFQTGWSFANDRTWRPWFGTPASSSSCPKRGEAISKHYFDALQRDPDVIPAHAEMAKVLGSRKRTT